MFTIVLATDSNEQRAAAQASTVATYPCAAAEVEVVVVHVASEVTGDEGGKINLEEYADVPDSVSRAVTELKSADIETRAHTRSGDPATEIIAAAREEDADQIVVGGRKRTPVGKAILGSVVQDVILNADRPVVTLQQSD